MAPNGDLRPFTVSGAVLSAVGLFLSVISLTRLSAVQSLDVFWFCLGLALFILGIGLLSYVMEAWTGTTLGWGVPVTFGSLATLVALVVWAAQNGDVTLLAITAGAIGGVGHEVAQSSGNIVLPGKQEPDSSGKKPPDNEFYLGSLSGLFLGGIAGVLILSATSEAGLSLGLTAFTAGLALKGVSEAVSTVATHS